MKRFLEVLQVGASIFLLLFGGIVPMSVASAWATEHCNITRVTEQTVTHSWRADAGLLGGDGAPRVAINGQQWNMDTDFWLSHPVGSTVRVVTVIPECEALPEDWYTLAGWFLVKIIAPPRCERYIDIDGYRSHWDRQRLAYPCEVWRTP